jgi:hypothetical protein
MPIATLPITNRKFYRITSLTLVQSIFPSQTLSLEPFVEVFSQRLLGLPDKAMKPIRTAGDGRKPTYTDELFKLDHEALCGEPLHRMNARALSDIASTLNGLGLVFKPESLFA